MSKVFTKDFTIALVVFIVIMAIACTAILLVNTQEVSAPAVLEPTAEETNEEEMKIRVQKYETKEPLDCTRWVQYIPINNVLYPIYHISCK